MNTKGTAYGTYSLCKGKYQVTGNTPLDQTRINLGVYKTEKEAEEVLNKFNFDFFSKYTSLLPKCIAINRTRKKFLFTLPLKNKTNFAFQSENLDEVVEFKNNFILKLI